MRLYHHRIGRRIVVGIVNVVRGIAGAVQIALGLVIIGIDDLLGGCGGGLLVLVADKAGMIARRERDTLASASSGTHAVVVVGITVCATTPRSLRRG